MGFAKALLSLSVNNIEPGDYQDDEGYWVCGKCKFRKEIEIVFPERRGDAPKPHRVYCACQCGAGENRAMREKAERQAFAQKVLRLRRAGFSDPSYRRSFAEDDGADIRNGRIAREYVKKWPEIYTKGKGLLYFGGVGTGKTFWACCIASALIEQGISAYVISMPMLLQKLQSMGFNSDKNDYIISLQKFGLLVIDDLGAERDTSYAKEQMTMVIDARYRSKKPMILTTNLSPGELKDPENRDLERAYDRILERCVPVKVSGQSRRVVLRDQTRSEMSQILGIEI